MYSLKSKQKIKKIIRDEQKDEIRMYDDRWFNLCKRYFGRKANVLEHYNDFNTVRVLFLGMDEPSGTWTTNFFEKYLRLELE